jgi:hypothetical protein
MSLKALKKGKKLSPLNLSNNKQPNYVPNGPFHRKNAIYNRIGRTNYAMLNNRSKASVRGRMHTGFSSPMYGSPNRVIDMQIVNNEGTPRVGYNYIKGRETNNGYVVERKMALESEPLQWRNTTHNNRSQPRKERPVPDGKPLLPLIPIGGTRRRRRSKRSKRSRRH